MTKKKPGAPRGRPPVPIERDPQRFQIACIWAFLGFGLGRDGRWFPRGRFRGAAIGGFRGGAVRGGFGRVGIAGLGFRGPVVGRGVRVAGFRGGRGWGGWGLPLAGLGLGLGYYGYPYYSSYYSDPCVVWDGYTWVNICY
jgi:hypothetical protein